MSSSAVGLLKPAIETGHLVHDRDKNGIHVPGIFLRKRLDLRSECSLTLVAGERCQFVTAHYRLNGYLARMGSIEDCV